MSKDILKIAIVGPESTGKSSLAEQLAVHYNTLWVPEYARAYLDKLSHPYTESDLLDIARGQLAMESSLSKKASRYLFCDTNLHVIKIWSEYKYKRCHTEILRNLHNDNYALHLLTNIDLPWEYDPQREHPHLRDFFFRLV